MLLVQDKSNHGLPLPSFQGKALIARCANHQLAELARGHLFQAQVRRVKNEPVPEELIELVAASYNQYLRLSQSCNHRLSSQAEARHSVLSYVHHFPLILVFNDIKSLNSQLTSPVLI